MNYRCATEDDTEDDFGKRPEDQTLSGRLPENFEDDEDRQSLRTDNEDEEREEDEEDEGGQDEEEQEGEEEDDNVLDASSADSSEQEDAEKARNCGDGGTPACSRRCQWRVIGDQSPLLGRFGNGKEWIIISEIPKADRCPDAIRREISNMLAHELSKAAYRIPDADLVWGPNNYGGWKLKDVRFQDYLAFVRLPILMFMAFFVRTDVFNKGLVCFNEHAKMVCFNEHAKMPYVVSVWLQE